MPIRIVNPSIFHNFVEIKRPEFVVDHGGVKIPFIWREDDDDPRTATLYIGSVHHPRAPHDEGIVTTDVPNDLTRVIRGMSFLGVTSGVLDRFEVETKAFKAISTYRPFFTNYTSGILCVLAAVLRMIIRTNPSEVNKKLRNLAATIDVQFNSYSTNDL